jgi:hypothetical protein
LIFYVNFNLLWLILKQIRIQIWVMHRLEYLKLQEILR